MLSFANRLSCNLPGSTFAECKDILNLLDINTILWDFQWRKDLRHHIQILSSSKALLIPKSLVIKRNCSREKWKEGKQIASTWCFEQIQSITRSLALQQYSWRGSESIAEVSVEFRRTALCYSCHDLLRWSELRGEGAAGWWAKKGVCVLNTLWGIKQLPLRNSLFNRNFESISFRVCSAQLPLLPFSSA